MSKSLPPLGFRGRFTLITGASSGLGAEMARHLAKDHGANLILTARRKERLEALALELQTRHGISAVTVAADLSRLDEAERLFAEATLGRDVQAVILNAGVTYFGKLLELRWNAFETLLTTNVLSPVKLARLFVPHLAERARSGGLLLISSLAGSMPVPYQTDYAAMKAFLTSFGQGLAYEVRDLGLSVTTFLPGGIATEMLEKSGTSRIAKPGDVGIMPVETCARLAIEAFRRRDFVSVPGSANKLSLALAAALPRKLMAGVVGRLYEKGLREPGAG